MYYYVLEKVNCPTYYLLLPIRKPNKLPLCYYYSRYAANFFKFNFSLNFNLALDVSLYLGCILRLLHFRWLLLHSGDRSEHCLIVADVLLKPVGKLQCRKRG